jgi:RNA polymerase sigma-70 factor (ECF subfamily)
MTGQEGEMSRSHSAAFEQAVLPHLDAAYNLARWLVRDGTLAEDVVQDAVLRALSYFASYRRDGNGRAWLLRIVRNAAFDTIAMRRRSVATSLNDAGLMAGDGSVTTIEIADPADNPEAALARSEGFSSLDQALAALSAELRECLVLRELEGLAYKEIAKITGVPTGTVMSRLWRARKTLLHMSVCEADFNSAPKPAQPSLVDHGRH